MYISSDLHFFHNKVLEFQSHTRPFKDIDEMNQAYVDHWNSLAVKRGIKMFHLGDFSFGSPSQTEEVASQLKGDIIFIKGNHDRSHTIKVLEKYGEVKDYHEEKYKKHLFCMMHYPIYEWNKQHHGSFMLHGHCVDMDTEILTSTGWKYRKDLDYSDLVASYNKDEKSVIFNKINNIIDINFTGDVYHYTGKSYDQRVTKGHTMVGLTPANKWFELPVEICLKQFKFIQSGSYKSNGLGLGKKLIELYVSIVADGSIKEETDLVRLRVKKERKKSYYKNLLIELGIEYKSYEQKDGSLSYNFYLPFSLKGYKIKGMDKKLIDMNEEEWDGFYTAMGQSDGTQYGNYISYTTAKKSEVDLIQSLCILHNCRATWSMRVHGFSKNITYSLNITKYNKVNVLNKDNLNITYVENERFWCIKTPLQNFFIRRNGKVSLTGNCHGKMVDSEESRGRTMDVGIDVHGRFLHFDEVFDILTKREIVTAWGRGR